MTYNMDKLFEAVDAKGHVCVGLDTAAEYIPPMEKRRAASDAEAVIAYNKAVINAVFDSAACFKIQIAYYEAMGLAGLAAYAQTLRYIREKGGLVIADIKRGDIADTACRYAKAHFDGGFEADFVTLSPYMGMDSIEPWLAYADHKGKGAFVLMRTSNKGMRDFEYLELKQEGGSPPLAPALPHNGVEFASQTPERPNAESGKSSATPPTGAAAPVTPPSPTRLYHAVGNKLAELAAAHTGKHGYGAFGAVVGCTEAEEAAGIRSIYPALFFLIPGYGAQGGAAHDAAVLLRNGNGGVVNASRSILKAWKAEPAQSGGNTEMTTNALAAEAARKAAIAMRDAIHAAVRHNKAAQQ